MHVAISVVLLVLHFPLSSEPKGALHNQDIDPNLINMHVHRTIDVSSQLVKVNVTIRMQNTGERAILGFLHATENKYKKGLSYIAVYTKGKVMYRLRISDAKVENYKIASFKYIAFREALLPQSSTRILIETIYAHRLVASPRYVKHSGSQFVHFQDSHYFYSPYVTMVQRTKVILSSQKIKRYTDLTPSVQSGNECKFGPYYNISDFKTSVMMFHYENRSPFLIVTRLLRIIIVSHWGSIHVKDSIYLENRGVIYEGQSKKEKIYSRNQYSFKTIIPRSAWDIHGQDMIGNMTTLKVKRYRTFTELALKPRIAVATRVTYYNISYLLPTQDVLYYDENDYVLKMRLIDHVFHNMCIEEAEIKVVLPEGASEVMFFVPIRTYRLPDSVQNLFLDFDGRPVVSVLTTNLVDKHVCDFELLYTYERTSLLKKPVIFVVFIFIVFMLLISCCRAYFHEKEKTD